jgi:dCTP deaminase
MVIEEGILTHKEIKILCDRGIITSKDPFERSQFQPCSLDLRIGGHAFVVKSTFMPGSDSVEEKIRKLGGHELNLLNGAVLLQDNIYIIPLLEELKLPQTLKGKTNPKSTTGRLDIFSRVITDRCYKFDEISKGYRGKLYLEVSPKSFNIKVRKGDSLCQLRLKQGRARLSDNELMEYIEKHKMVFYSNRKPINIGDLMLKEGIFLSIDLAYQRSDPYRIVGFQANKTNNLVDFSKRSFYPATEFWKPITAPLDDKIILDPGEFYIFSSNERILIPPSLSAEIIPYDIHIGELRTHYAGFIDSGFGYSKMKTGSKLVLEVRCREVPFLIEHEQVFFRVVFDKNISCPEIIYGDKISSNYQNQNVKLAKQFTVEKRGQTNFPNF